MQEKDDKIDIKSWKLIGLVILSIRFVQGWIFWGGGSRRFIYDPAKLDPYSTEWLANKLQSAMPGALLGMEHVVSFLLQHFVLLYTSVIIFSFVELVCGLGLLFGFLTRFCGFITTLLSIVLMLLFGWQGETCMDEWTMAVATFSMGLTLTISGAYVYSIDYFLMHRFPRIAKKRWFKLIASGALSYSKLKIISVSFFIFTFLFTVLTYNYLRGSIFTPYHGGPVSPTEHRLALSQGLLQPNGSVTFVAYVDAGTPATPSHIIRIELVNHKGSLIEVWQPNELSKLSPDLIKNTYDYNRIVTGPYGLVAPLSAKAEITLPSVRSNLRLLGTYQLHVFLINGRRFDLSFSLP